MMVIGIRGVLVHLSNHDNGFCGIKVQENAEHAKIEQTTIHYLMRPGFLGRSTIM